MPGTTVTSRSMDAELPAPPDVPEPAASGLLASGLVGSGPVAIGWLAADGLPDDGLGDGLPGADGLGAGWVADGLGDGLPGADGLGDGLLGAGWAGADWLGARWAGADWLGADWAGAGLSAAAGWGLAGGFTPVSVALGWSGLLAEGGLGGWSGVRLSSGSGPRPEGETGSRVGGSARRNGRGGSTLPVALDRDESRPARRSSSSTLGGPSEPAALGGASGPDRDRVAATAELRVSRAGAAG